MRLLVLEDNKLISTLHAANGPLTVGSSPTAFVHLNDPRIIAHQASILRDAEGQWWLEVADDRRPTHLNRAVQHGRAKLRHADEIEMGIFCIRLFMENELSGEAMQRKRMQNLTRNHGGSLPLGTIIVKEDKELCLSRDHIGHMTHLSMALEQAGGAQDLMLPAVQGLLRAFSARRAWIGIRLADRGDFDWSLGYSHKGSPCPRPAFSANMQPRCLDKGHYVCTPRTRLEGVGSAMGAPITGESGRLGMLYVENDPADPPFDEQSLDVLTAMSCCTALPLADYLHKAAVKKKEVLSAEHTVARLIQDAVTPQALPQWDNLQVAAFRHLGSGHSGDLYDIMQLRDKAAAILLARLEAGGAALPRLFAEVRTAFRMAVLHGDTPVQFVRALNWLTHTRDAQRRVDALCVWFQPATGEVKYCRAGDRVLLGRMQADGTCEMTAHDGSVPAGRGRAAEYVLHSMAIGSGDSLIIASDGAKTATNARGEAFGIEGMKDSLCDGLGDTPSHVLSEFATDLQDFVAGGRCPDDVSVVLLQRA